MPRADLCCEEPRTSVQGLGASRVHLRRWKPVHQRPRRNAKTEHKGGPTSGRAMRDGASTTAQKRTAPESLILGVLDRTSDAPKVHDLKRRKEVLVVSGGALDTEGAEEDVQKLFRYSEDATVQVYKWITEAPYAAFEGVATACKEDSPEDGDLPQWTTKDNQQVLEPSVERHRSTK